MNEQQILQAAIDAQKAGGPLAMVEIFLDRLPKSRHVKMMRLRPNGGPRGRIVALSPAGTTCQFECGRVIIFLSPTTERARSYTNFSPSKSDKHRLCAVISGNSYRAINDFAEAQKLSLGAIIDAALSQYLQGSTI